MDKRTVLITGAASGIGRETALLFARNGWFVGGLDTDAEGLERLSMEIGGGNGYFRRADVADPQGVKAAVAGFADSTEGRLDLLINNAGVLTFGAFGDVDLERHLGIVDVNLKGCLTCTFHALPLLKKTPLSRIINISSASALYGTPDLSVYSATKHALSALTEAWNIEFERYGIFVCDIRPPYVSTPLLNGAGDVPSVRRLGVRFTPDAIARFIWKAAHKKRLHWDIGTTKLLSVYLHLLPFAVRPLVRALTVARP